ncbi:ribosomal RNA processing protein 1 homolog B isoform X1 [Cherax quadricarinatus]
MTPAAVAPVTSVGTMKEILFAQRLADNEKKVRDKALKKLKTYLSVKSSGGRGLSDDDALKIWKGLFYCMYMADKPLIQEDLAEEISSIFSIINNRDDCRSFIKAAFTTFAREWNGIDVFRIDKFMMFVRRVLRQVFVYLRNCEWDMKEILSFTTILEVTVVCPEDDVNATPLGLKFHVCDIILEELAKIGGEALDNRVIIAILKPYFKVLALTSQYVYFKSVSEGIVRHLMRQSSLGVKHEDGQAKANTENEGDEEMADRESEDGSEDEILDPRAGQVDACIPQLRPDFNLLADSLQSIGAVSKVRKANRQRIFKLVNELRDVAQGFYPLAAPRDNVGNNLEVSDSEVEKAAERLQKFNEDLCKGNIIKAENEDKYPVPLKSVSFKKKLSKKTKLRLAKKGRNPKNKGLSKKEKRRLDKHQKKIALKRKLAVENKLQLVAALSGLSRNKPSNKPSTLESKVSKGINGFQVCPAIQKTKKANSTSQGDTSGFIIESTKSVHCGKKRKLLERTEKLVKKKKNSFAVSDFISPLKAVSSNIQETTEEKINKVVINPLVDDTKEAENGKNFKSSGSEVCSTVSKTKISYDKHSGSDISHKSDNCEKPLSSSKSDIVSCGTNNGLVVSGTSEKTVASDSNKKALTPIESMNNSSELVLNFSSNYKQRGFESDGGINKKSPWDEPLKKGEIEIFIKSKRQIKKEKKNKVLRSPKKLSKASFQKARTININLKKNREHEYSDYARTLRASPRIPFNASEQPKAPVLKPSPFPILVKKPLLKKTKTVGSSFAPKFIKGKRALAADYF